MEAWVSESLPMYTEDAQPTGWRSNMAKFGMDVLATGTAKQPLPRPEGTLRTEIRWFGQVLDVSPTLPSTIGLLIFPLHSSISMEVFKLFYHMTKLSQYRYLAFPCSEIWTIWHGIWGEY